MVEEDKRFARVKYDPRFRHVKKKSLKLQVDKRFEKVFKDKDFQAPSTVDKYGRKIREAEKENLEKFYRLENEEMETSEVEQVEEEQEESEVSSSGEDEEQEIVEGEEEIQLDHPSARTDVELGDASKRIAVMSMDWDNLRAADLMKVFDSFKPARGAVKSVKIYLSEFGKQRMREEMLNGPPKSIFTAEEKDETEKYPESDQNESDEEEDHEQVDEEESFSSAEEENLESNADFDSEEEDFEKQEPFQIQEQKDEDAINQKELRKYQLDRLKYYYAVVECDSVKTAVAIYNSCDGLEFEQSSNIFDLRYIPDEMEFNDEDLKEKIDQLPDKFEGKTFMTGVLQHSKVKLTWDDDDTDRVRLMKTKRISKDKLDEMDYKAYLASDSEDDEEAAERYRQLLMGGDEDPFGKKEMGDMEISFTPGLTEAAEEMVQKKIKEAEGNTEGVFEAYKRKQKEKKKQRKEEIKKQAEEQKEATRELFSKNKKKAKKDKTEKKEEVSVDTKDPRFNVMFESPLFAIDPTHPSFKETEGMKKILEERRSRNYRED